MPKEKSDLLFDENSSASDFDNGNRSPDSISGIDGIKSYNKNCMSCHGVLDNSAKLDSTLDSISTAIKDVDEMAHLKVLSEEELIAITKALKIETESAFIMPEVEPMCIDEETVPKTESKVLSATELSNVIKDLFGQEAVDKVQVELSSIKNDSKSGFSTFQTEINAILIRSYFHIMKKVAPIAATKIIGKNNCIDDLGASKKDDITGDCINELISHWGLKILRRPLSANEINSFKSLFESLNEQNIKKSLEGLMLGMLLNPDFFFVFNNQGKLIGDTFTLNNYEIASKLSFTLWQTSPDNELYEAAAKGELTERSKFKEQLDRMTSDQRAKKTILKFYKEWFQLNKEVPNSYTNHFLSPNFDKGEVAQVYPRAMIEADRFLEQIVFESDGKFEDLFTSNWTNLNGLNDISEIYGTDEKSRKLPNQTRSGILTRAAMHITGSNWKHPMHFGAYIRRNILCDELPDPPADFDVPETKAGDEFASNSRQKFEKLVESPNCIGCHKSINGLAFTFENIDPIGRSIEKEKLYDANANFVASVEIDTKTVPLIYYGDKSTVNNGVELSQKISESNKAKQCFSKKLTKFLKGRNIVSHDGCDVDNIYKQVKSGKSLLEIFKLQILNDRFFKKRVNN